MHGGRTIDSKDNVGRYVCIGLLLGVTAAWISVLMLISAWQDPKTPDVGPQAGTALEPYLAHFALYGILGFLVSLDVCYIKGRQYGALGIIAALVVGLVWGSATEGYELFVPDRAASFLDVLTNTLGAVCGGLLLVWPYRLIRSRAYDS